MFDARDLKTQRSTQPSAVHDGLPIASPNRQAVSLPLDAARIWCTLTPKTHGKCPLSGAGGANTVVRRPSTACFSAVIRIFLLDIPIVCNNL